MTGCFARPLRNGWSVKAPPSRRVASLPLRSRRDGAFLFRQRLAPRLVAARRAADDPEGCAERLLEWDELCAHVSRFATTSAGKRACRRLRRGRDVDEALHLQAETAAVQILVSQFKVDVSFGSLSTELVIRALERCRRGGMLSGTQLLGIATLISVATSLRKALLAPFRKRDTYQEARKLTHVICQPWSEMEMDLELLNLITFAVDEEGLVKASASLELQKTRDAYQRVRQKLEKFLRSYTGEIVERTGRLCVALPSGAAVPSNALVLDAGSSGTVYCEPRSALSLNNDMSVAYAEMKNAEESVLWNLTSHVVHAAVTLTELFHLIVELDAAVARHRYTEWIDGALPQFSSSDGETAGNEDAFFLSLINLRHPLLLGQSLIYEEANARSSRRDSFTLAPPVPNDVILSPQTKALVITGPNAGGKTATLKALGLCAMMAKAGLGLPAKHPVWVPFYSSVLADIGDEQSLTSSLSTFSGHLHRIQSLRSVADGKCLILLDELGTGTDPKEGAALGVALLKRLVKGGPCGALTTVVSTHHGLLKNLAYEQQIEREDGSFYSVFENASMEFDDEALAPTYRLTMGVPGKSNALNIASRLGMDLRIIGAARSRLGQQHFSENILISKIQGEQEGIEQTTDRIENIEEKIKQTNKQIQEVEQRRASLEYQMVAQQADDYRQACDRGFASLELLKHKADQAAFFAAPPTLRAPDPEAEPHLAVEPEIREIIDWNPSVGDAVFVPELGRSATLIKVLPKNRAVIRTGSLTITVESATLQPL